MKANKTAVTIEIVNKFITSGSGWIDHRTVRVGGALPAGGEGQREQWEEESAALFNCTKSDAAT